MEINENQWDLIFKPKALEDRIFFKIYPVIGLVGLIRNIELYMLLILTKKPSTSIPFTDITVKNSILPFHVGDKYG